MLVLINAIKTCYFLSLLVIVWFSEKYLLSERTERNLIDDAI